MFFLSFFLSQGKPNAPSKPRIDDIEARHVGITWSPPSYDGGTPITGYTVETNEISGSYQNKIKVEGSRYTIKGLKESHSYRFRVAAENKVGDGPFSEHSSCITTYGKIIVIEWMIKIIIAL